MHKKDIGLGVVSVAFGAWMFFAATKLKSGAAFWPKLVAAGIILLGVIITVTAIKSVRSKKTAPEKKTSLAQYLNVLEVVALLFAYYFGFQIIGYTIPTFLLIAGTALILGYRNWKALIPTAAIVSVCLYLAFTYLFGINFPGVFF